MAMASGAKGAKPSHDPSPGDTSNSSQSCKPIRAPTVVIGRRRSPLSHTRPPPASNSREKTSIRCSDTWPAPQNTSSRAARVSRPPCSRARRQRGLPNSGASGGRGGWRIWSAVAGRASKTTVQAGSMTRCSRAIWTGSRIRGWLLSTKGSSPKTAMGIWMARV